MVLLPNMTGLFVPCTTVYLVHCRDSASWKPLVGVRSDGIKKKLYDES